MGLSVLEIAALDGVPVPTAKARLRRGRIALVSLLEEVERPDDNLLNRTPADQNQDRDSKGKDNKTKPGPAPASGTGRNPSAPAG